MFLKLVRLGFEYNKKKIIKAMVCTSHNNYPTNLKLSDDYQILMYMYLYSHKYFCFRRITTVSICQFLLPKKSLVSLFTPYAS